MQFLLSFLAVLGVALLLVTRCKINPSVAPFLSIASITLFCCLGGMLNLLYVSVLLVYALAVFSFVWVFAVKKCKWREVLAKFFTPGMVFFIAVSIFFFIVMSTKQPYFKHWDEFSFWGTAVKNIFEHKQLYTQFSSSMINISYPPALPVWSAFMQFFGPRFLEWGVYLAYDILMMSVVTMLFSRLTWKNYIAIPALAFFCVFGLYIFWHSFEGTYAYYSAYADVPLGFAFAGVLLAWFSSDDRGFGRYLGVAAALAFLALVKDMGFAFGLIAAMIIAFDLFINGATPTDRIFKKERKWLARLLWSLALFAVVVVFYKLWSVHLSLAVQLNNAPNPYPYSIFDMLAGRDEYFNRMATNCIDMLSTTNLALFGTIRTLLIVFTALPVAYALLCKRRRDIVRMIVTSVLLLLGFVAYYAFMIYAFTAIFYHTDAAMPMSYERYIASYTIGWYYAVAGLLFLPVGQTRFKKGQLAPAVVVLAAAILSIFHFKTVPVNQFVLTSDRLLVQENELRATLRSIAQKFDGAFTDEDRLYYVCQDSDGGEWFMFNYQYMPAQTVVTLGGGNFVPVGSNSTEPYAAEVGVEEFTDYILEKGITYVYVQKIDDYFYAEFAPMFTDALTGFYDGTAYMYKVLRESDGSVMLKPVYGTQMVEMLRAEYGY